MCPPYPQRDRKRRLNGAVCRNHRKKEWSRVGVWTGTLKNPTKCLWRWEPDRRSNFFFNPPAHLCAVTYMTEISLIVTLNNQFHLTSPPNENARIQWHVGSVAMRVMMVASVLQRPLAVLIARATITHPPSPALFGYKRRISNALRQRWVSRTVTRRDL